METAPPPPVMPPALPVPPVLPALVTPAPIAPEFSSLGYKRTGESARGLPRLDAQNIGLGEGDDVALDDDVQVIFER